MKYVLALLSGLLAGAAVAAALVFFNPLTSTQTLPESDAPWVLNYSLAPDSSWITTHDRELPLALAPNDVARLWEGGIRHSLLSAMPMPAASGGPNAVASRISVPSVETELLLTGIPSDDFWLISVPGEGTLFVHSVSNLWPLLRDTLVRVDWLGRSFEGPRTYGPTQGPQPYGAEIHGLNGSFAGISGRSRERLSLTGYSRTDGGLSAVSGQMLLELSQPVP